MNTKDELKLPFYAKAAFLILGSYFFFKILFIAQGIIVPLVFSILVAILLQPVVFFFVRLGINRIVSIIITLIIALLVIFAFSSIILSQVSKFSESWPDMVDKFTEIINQAISAASETFDINPKKLHDWIIKTKDALIEKHSTIIAKAIFNVGNGILIMLLVPIYIFLILIYQTLLLEFIRRLFKNYNHIQVSKIIRDIKTVIQHYLVGLVIEASIVGTLYSVTLLILGIDNALLLGIIGACINVIPYVGGLVGVALPMIVALVTKETIWPAIYIMIGYYLIQLIDNNFIIPKIVASRVKINALFSIIIVLAGNALWGIAGMFLSIPLLAIIKLILDNIEPLKPWGFLLGDTIPQIKKNKTIFKLKK